MRQSSPFLLFAFTCLCAFAFHQMILTIGIEEIRRTYGILAEPYRHLSIAHGAIWAESNIIHNYYDFGNVTPPPRGQWLPEGDGPIRLIHALFTSVNHNFTISTNASYPAKHLHASTIATIIVYLNHHKRPSIDELEMRIVNEDSFKKSVAGTNEKRKQLRDANEISKHDTKRLFKALSLREEKALLEQQLQNLEQLTGREKNKAQKKINRIKKRIDQIEHTKITGDCNRVYELAKAILDTADHQSPHHYAPYAAYAILQAFLYKKAKTKRDLYDYYHTLRKELGEEIFVKPGIIDEQRWLSARFDSSKFTTLQENLRTLHRQNSEIFLSLICSDLFEKFVYANIINRFYHSALPKKAEYAYVQFNGHAYPDCVETTLRNICNIIFYDRRTGNFDVNKKLNNGLDPRLFAFYQDERNKQAAAIEHPDVYQNWANILPDMPWITYRSMMYNAVDDKSIVVTAPEGIDGFIRGIPQYIAQQCQQEQDKIKIADRWYILVTQSDIHLFEMIPTIRNFIVSLNKLLGLQLYESEEKAFLQPTFNAAYFSSLCKSLVPLGQLQLNPHEIATLDKRDYAQEGIRFIGDRCEFVLLKNHAEFTMQQQQSTFIDCASGILNKIRNIGNPATTSQLMNLFSLVASIPEHIPQQLAYQLMFALDLQNHEEKINLLKQYMQPTVLSRLGADIRAKTISVAAKVMKALPIRFDWIYQIRCIDAVDPKLYSHSEIEPIIQQWKDIGYKRLYDETQEPDSVPDYFAALVRRGTHYEEGVHLARRCLQHVAPQMKKPEVQWLVKESALKLYHALAEKNQFRQEALQASYQLPNAPIAKNIQAIAKPLPQRLTLFEELDQKV